MQFGVPSVVYAQQQDIDHGDEECTLRSCHMSVSLVFTDAENNA